MDLFGRKKRRRARIDMYKALYKVMSTPERRIEVDHLRGCVRTGLCNGSTIIEQLTAAAEVEREEANADHR